MSTEDHKDKFDLIVIKYLTQGYYVAMLSNRRHRLDMLHELVEFFFMYKLENEDTQYVRYLLTELRNTGIFNP